MNNKDIQGYALRIKSAAQADSALRESIARKINPPQAGDVRHSNLAVILKEVGLAFRPLTEQDRHAAVVQIANLLPFNNEQRFDLIIKEASNDEFMNLANYWNDFFE
jgi:hypothetical protein